MENSHKMIYILIGLIAFLCPGFIRIIFEPMNVISTVQGESVSFIMTPDVATFNFIFWGAFCLVFLIALLFRGRVSALMHSAFPSNIRNRWCALGLVITILATPLIFLGYRQLTRKLTVSDHRAVVYLGWFQKTTLPLKNISRWELEIEARLKKNRKDNLTFWLKAPEATASQVEADSPSLVIPWNFYITVSAERAAAELEPLLQSIKGIPGTRVLK